MSISEQLTWDGRLITISWMDGPPTPPSAFVTQASGVCFTPEGGVVLVAGADEEWSFPGGHPEPGETLAETLCREVREEACAIVTDLVYIGAQHVDDPLSPTGETSYYQARFWARVQLEPFMPQHETQYRRIVVPADVLPTLAWSTTKVAEALLHAALAVEQQTKGY
ncbi:MAG: NUDIX domain-containing protein [Herpetosiphonaceae bacterium]|nr:NUDIX domain-containing protein [Herpetosiphonaceae bacterium]